jgi:hypothetical protein
MKLSHFNEKHVLDTQGRIESKVASKQPQKLPFESKLDCAKSKSSKKDEVPGSRPVGGDRWCIMSLAMRVGGLEVV